MKRALLTILISMSLAGCAGEFEIDGSPAMTPGEGDTTPVQYDPVTGEPIEDGGDEESTEEDLGPAFELEKENVVLLPFHVRMAKLSRVTGLPTDAPVFDAVYARRYDLGDHNYGQNIGPDLQWNASKMAIWMEAMQPICSSTAMKDLYPILPEHLNELLSAAYGRETTADELAVFEDELAASGELSDEETYQAVCLSVLASTEFVAQ